MLSIPLERLPQAFDEIKTVTLCLAALVQSLRISGLTEEQLREGLHIQATQDRVDDGKAEVGFRARTCKQEA